MQYRSAAHSSTRCSARARWLRGDAVRGWTKPSSMPPQRFRYLPWIDSTPTILYGAWRNGGIESTAGPLIHARTPASACPFASRPPAAPGKTAQKYCPPPHVPNGSYSNPGCAAASGRCLIWKRRKTTNRCRKTCSGPLLLRQFEGERKGPEQVFWYWLVVFRLFQNQAPA